MIDPGWKSAFVESPAQWLHLQLRPISRHFSKKSHRLESGDVQYARAANISTRSIIVVCGLSAIEHIGSGKHALPRKKEREQFGNRLCLMGNSGGDGEEKWRLGEERKREESRVDRTQRWTVVGGGEKSNRKGVWSRKKLMDKWCRTFLSRVFSLINWEIN